MALVIFCVALTEAMRFRRSFKRRHRRSSYWQSAQRREGGLQANDLSKSETSLELRPDVVAQILVLADFVEQVGMLAAQ
jgi:hypothetical protein